MRAAGSQPQQVTYMQLSPRLAREFKTITAMVSLYCRGNHQSPTGEMCKECRAFLNYARKRLSRCPFSEQKPTCGKCTVHCYSKEMQDEARQIMRYSGPKMVWHHPLLALYHLLDGRRKAPELRSVRQARKKHQSE